MTPQGFINLAVQTVTAPQDVARLLISLRLHRDVLVLLFGLVIVLNTIFFAGSLMLRADVAQMPFVAANPMIFGVILGVSVLLTVLALTWAGRGLGGGAQLEQMAVLLIWLQALRVLVQAGMMVLVPISGTIAGLLSIMASAVGLWILVNFVDVAHDFGNLFKSLMVLILGVLGMGLALSLVFSVLGLTVNGWAGYV